MTDIATIRLKHRKRPKLSRGERTTIEHAIAYIARKAIGKVSKIKLIKVLYLAEKINLKDHQYFYLNDSLESWTNGPVCREALGMLEGNKARDTKNYVYCKRNKGEKYSTVYTHWDGKDVEDLGFLCPAFIESLDKAWDKIGHMSYTEIIKWAHDENENPEWQKPNYLNENAGIKLGKLMQSMGITDKNEIAEIKRNILRL